MLYQRNKSKQNIWKWIAIVAVAALAILMIIFALLTFGPKDSAAQNNQIVKTVGRLILLPDGEAPTVATVKDSAKLKGQAFFTRAKDGDKVLIYKKARRAYLYRPSSHRLVEVAGLSTSTAAQ